MSLPLNIQEGQDLKISFDIDCREYNGRWYNDIRAWRVEPDNESGGMQPIDQPLPPPEIPPGVFMNLSRAGTLALKLSAPIKDTKSFYSNIKNNLKYLEMKFHNSKQCADRTHDVFVLLPARTRAACTELRSEYLLH